MTILCSVQHLLRWGLVVSEQSWQSGWKFLCWNQRSVVWTWRRDMRESFISCLRLLISQAMRRCTEQDGSCSVLVPVLCSLQRFLGQMQCWCKPLSPYRLKMVWLCAHQFLQLCWGWKGKARGGFSQNSLSRASFDTHLPVAFPATLLLWGVQLSSADLWLHQPPFPTSPIPPLLLLHLAREIFKSHSFHSSQQKLKVISKSC